MKQQKQIHFPNSFEDYNKARTRLVFEELLIMQLALLTFKTNYDKDKRVLVLVQMPKCLK